MCLSTRETKDLAGDPGVELCIYEEFQTRLVRKADEKKNCCEPRKDMKCEEETSRGRTFKY